MNIEWLHKYHAYKAFYENTAKLVIEHKECCMKECKSCSGLSWSSDLAHELSKIDVEWYKKFNKDDDNVK